MKKKSVIRMILALSLSLTRVLGMTSLAGAAQDTPFTTYAFAETENGWLMGYQEDTTYIFKGIKYGVAERFMPAEKAPAWQGVQGALEYGATCPNGASSASSVSVSAFVYPL